MNTRLKLFLEAHNLTQAEFADNINVVRASVSHVLSGRNNPSYEFIRSIMLKYPELSIEWLMFGKGTMYKTMSTLPPKPAEPVEQEIFPETDEDEDEDEDEDIVTEVPEAPIIETRTSDTLPQVTVNQRKVNKVIILFDDGTYQEM